MLPLFKKKPKITMKPPRGNTRNQPEIKLRVEPD
ncbi:hypothetical protein E308F_25350 [Moorella sp. E308F]|nr:hypothetical protein E308F_25350 [Moorella sp. E308F]